MNNLQQPYLKIFNSQRSIVKHRENVTDIKNLGLEDISNLALSVFTKLCKRAWILAKYWPICGWKYIGICIDKNIDLEDI